MKAVRSGLLAIVALAGIVLASAPATAPTTASAPAVAAPTTWDITNYNSGDTSERTSRLTLGLYPAPAPKYVVFCIDLGTVPVGGEILDVKADLEVTNNLGYNVSVVTQVMLLESCSHVDGNEIAEANGENAIPAVHHEVPVRVGTFTVGGGNVRRFVGLIAWASSTATQSGDYLQVMQDYGRMAVIRFTPGS